MKKLEKEKEKPRPSTLDMLLYLAWWKICDIQEFIKRILKIERSKK